MPDEAATAPQFPPPAPVPDYPPPAPVPEYPPPTPAPQYPPPQQYPPAYQQPVYPQPGYPQQGYPQQGYPQMPYGGPWYRPPITNGMATASLVLGIAGIFFWILVIPQVLAVVFGHVGLRAISLSKGQQTGQGQAIAGLILGYLELIGFIALVIAANSSA